MLTETTIAKLREMRFSVMAAALRDQLNDPQMQSLPFEDRLGLLRKPFLRRFLFQGCRLGIFSWKPVGIGV